MFIFYDTETTGINRVFDQILQFAAILTDENLNEVDRFNYRCKILQWVVPDPYALAVTRVSPSMLENQSLPSFYKMMSNIRAKLEEWGPAIYAGYNSIRFDELLLQRAFWQTLHPPYLTVSGGNSRIDILPVVQAASHLYKGVFKFPTTSKGKAGFKLDQLAPLNGCSHVKAHDALSDVEATICIAKILAEKCPLLWRSVEENAPKTKMANTLSHGTPSLHIEYFANGPSVWWGQRIDDNGHTSRSASVMRLDVDWENIFQLDNQDLAKRLSDSPKPLREIPLNKSPIVLDQQLAAKFGYFLDDTMAVRSKLLLSHSQKCSNVLRVFGEAKELGTTGEHLEQRIYEGFPSSEDRALMEKFHSSEWLEKAAIARDFKDERYRQIAHRLVFDAAPNLLDTHIQKQMRELIRTRVCAPHDDNELWRTIPQALDSLDNLGTSTEMGVDKEELRNWLETKLNSQCHH